MAVPVVFSSGANVRMFWNVDAAVGRASSNKQDDVELVQLGMRSIADNPRGEPTAEFKAIIARLRIGSLCTGREDDPLVQAIVQRQRDLQLPVDGKVSVMKNAGFYHDRTGSHTFLLIALNNNIMDRMLDTFPRLDRNPLCPATLKATSIRTLAPR